MWSKKPTPVATSTSPPSRSTATEISVSLVLRSMLAVRAIGSPILAAAGDGRFTVHREALGARERCDRRRERGRRGARNRDHRGPPAEGSHPQGAAEPRGATRRQDVIGAERVVAERGRPSGANEH